MTTCLAALVGITPLLRPALATARDRASQDLSHVKQLSTAVIIYGTDADDLFPLAFAPTPSGGYRIDARFTSSGGDHQGGQYNWATAIYPYCKSTKLYSSVGAPRVAVEGDLNPNLPGVGHSFNGLLHTFNSVEIEMPSEVVMFSQSYGFVNLEGWAVANPEMTCVPNRPCHYVSAQKNCGGTESGTTSRLRAYDAPQYGEETLGNGETGARVQVMARGDGSARTIRFDKAPSNSPYPAGEFFWSRLDAQAKPTSAWMDAFGCHPLRFRPDYKPEDDAYAREIPK